MPVAINGTATTAQTGTAATTSPAINKPGSTAVGEYLVWVICSSNTTLTTPTGWTAGFNHGYGTPSQRCSMYYRLVDGSEPASWTIDAAASTRWAMGMFRVSGVDAASPFDTTGTEAENAASTTAAHAGITTTKANQVVLWCCAFTTSAGNTTATGTPPAGFAEIFDVCSNSGSQANRTLSVSYLLFAAAGATGALNGTISEAVANQVVVATANVNSAAARSMYYAINGMR